MKKTFVFIAFIFCCSLTVAAQASGQGRSLEQRKTFLLEKTKPLNLTQAQSDSVVVIFTDVTSMVRLAGDASEEERTAALQANRQRQTKRLTNALGADLAQKVQQLIQPARGNP